MDITPRDLVDANSWQLGMPPEDQHDYNADAVEIVCNIAQTSNWNSDVEAAAAFVHSMAMVSPFADFNDETAFEVLFQYFSKPLDVNYIDFTSLISGIRSGFYILPQTSLWIHFHIKSNRSTEGSMKPTIAKVAARWLKTSEEEAMNQLYEYQDYTHPPKQLTRDALCSALDDDSIYSPEECVEYLLEQLQKEDSDSEEIDRMLSFLGHREKQAKVAMEEPYWLDDFLEIGGKVDEDGTTVLFHATTADTARLIQESGYMMSPPDAPDGYGVYFGSNASVDESYGDGTVLPVRLNINDLELDDEFPGERMDFMAVTSSNKYHPVAVGEEALRGQDQFYYETGASYSDFEESEEIEQGDIVAGNKSFNSRLQGEVTGFQDYGEERYVKIWSDAEGGVFQRLEDVSVTQKHSSLKMAVDYSDFGSNSRFLISPDGILTSWDKPSGGFGDAAADMEMADLEDADEDLQSDLKLNMGNDVYNEYRNEGYAYGVSSSGSFCLVNSPELTPAQASVLLDLVRDNGLRNVVLHEGRSKQMFSNPRELMNYLSPIANS